MQVQQLGSAISFNVLHLFEFLPSESYLSAIIVSVVFAVIARQCKLRITIKWLRCIVWLGAFT